MVSVSYKPFETGTSIVVIWITSVRQEHEFSQLVNLLCSSSVSLPGLKVDGLYRRCGLATKVSSLVEALSRSPKTAPLEKDEQGLLDAAGALKQYVRQQVVLIPQTQRELWVKAAGSVLCILNNPGKNVFP